MASYVGFSPHNPNRYVGPNLYLSTIVVRNRQPTGADYRLPANGKIYCVGSYWILSKTPLNGVEGEIWYLSKVVANVAYWLKLSSGGAGPVTEIAVQDTYAPGVNPVLPSVIGEFFFNASSVANASKPVRTTTRSLNTMNVEIQYATSEAVSDATKVGLASFLSTQFDVDSVGFVSLKGSTGPVVSKVTVDAHTAPGTNPVVPDATGTMIVTGSSTPAGTHPVQTNSLAANTYAIQVQKTQAIASTDATKVGLAAFNNADFTVDANGFVSTLNTPLPPSAGALNLGIKYSGSTFTVTSANGTALSSTNVAYVSMSSKTTPGQVVQIAITADQTFVDHTGASTIDGNLFGFTAGDVQSSDVPFFIYAVMNSAAGSPETAISFMISRQAARVLSPTAGNIGKTGSSIADTEYAFFALSSPTVADYASSPALMIGSFRMTKVSASDGWVVTTLAAQDGIGRFQENQFFQLTPGVLGSATGSFWQANGGTAPIFNAQSYDYLIQPNGWINIAHTGLTCSTNGAGAVDARLITPMRNWTTAGFPIQTGGYLLTAASSTLLPIPNGSSFFATMVYVTSSADGNLQLANLNAATQRVNINLYYFPKTS